MIDIPTRPMFRQKKNDAKHSSSSIHYFVFDPNVFGDGIKIHTSCFIWLQLSKNVFSLLVVLYRGIWIDFKGISNKDRVRYPGILQLYVDPTFLITPLCSHPPQSYHFPIF